MGSLFASLLHLITIG